MHIFENYVNMLSVEIGKKALKRKEKATQFNVHSKTGQAYAYVHIKESCTKKQSAIFIRPSNTKCCLSWLPIILAETK